jgi:hypothetical protein
LVHDYLPDYDVVMDRGIDWTGNTTLDLSMLVSFQISYVIIGTYATQLDNSTPLMQLVRSQGELVTTAVADGIPVAYLYRILRPVVHNIVWTPSGTNWTLTTSEGEHDEQSYQSELVLPIQFSSGYPPSEWTKASFQFSSPLNATSLRFSSIVSYQQISQATTTITLVDSNGNSAETTLISSSWGFLTTWKPDIPLSALSAKNSVNIASLNSIELTVYNAGQPSTGQVVVTGIELVN